MSDTNPFGGFDMNALLEQAQAMQQQMTSAQERLAEAEIEGTVADGLVAVTVDGTGELKSVKIRANSFDPAETEDLEDLIIAAYRDARAKADAAAAEAFGPLAGLAGDGGLGGLPGMPTLGGGQVPGPDDADGGGSSRSLGF